MKLNRYIASIDVASRRGADKLIREGKVLVNKEVEINPAYDLEENDIVNFTFDIDEYKESHIVIKLFKPIGYVVSSNPDEGRPIYNLVKDIGKIYPVGRLDKDSTGLIILTNDGVLHKKIIGAETNLEKEYLVTVVETLKDGALGKLEYGLSLDGVKLKKTVINKINDNSFYIILREGRNRQIRRMCRLVGYNIISLKRIRIGSIFLDGIKEGQFKALTEEEKKSLYN